MSRLPRLYTAQETIDLRQHIAGDVVQLGNDVVMLIDSPTTFRLALSSWQVIVGPHVQEPLVHFRRLLADAPDKPIILLLSPLHHRAYLSTMFDALDPRRVQYIAITPNRQITTHTPGDRVVIFWNRTDERITCPMPLVAERSPDALRRAMAETMARQHGYARRIVIAVGGAANTDVPRLALSATLERWCIVIETATVFVGALDNRFATATARAPLALNRLVKGKHTVHIFWCSAPYPHTTLAAVKRHADALAAAHSVKLLDVRMAKYGDNFAHHIYGPLTYFNVWRWEWLHTRKLALELLLVFHALPPTAFAAIAEWTCDLAFAPRELVIELASAVRASIRRTKVQ